MRTPLLIPTLRGYQARWVAPDLVAGLTLAAIAIPEQMATAHLADLPAVIGLYAFIAGSIAFFVLGASPHMSIGADSTIAPVFAAGVAAVSLPGGANYAHLVTALALVVGFLLIAVGLLKLGWIADFLSTPVVTGVLAGIAVTIVVRQLPAVLGLPGGGTTTIGRLEAIFDERAQINLWALAIAACVFTIVVVAGRIDHRIPGALIALIASTSAVAAFDLRSHGVEVVGRIQAGVPSFGLPSVDLDDLWRLAGTALTVAFVCIVQTAATARSGTSDPKPASKLNQDLIALGAGNLLAGVSASFPLNASPPRTGVVQASGGRTQATGLVATAGVLAVLAAAGLVTNLPVATLGAILIFVATRLFHVRDLARVLHFDRFEFALAVVTIAVVALIGIEQGVVTAMLLSLAQRTRLAARPRGVVLGREPGTDHWIPADIGRPTENVPGVLVYLLYAPLWYGNAAYVAARLRAALDDLPQPARALVIDADGMSDIDYTAARTVADLARDLHAKGVQVAIARTSHLVHHDLTRSGLLDDIGPDHLFASVQDAVTSLAAKQRGP